MPRCSVIKCKIYSGNKEKISVFQFPRKDDELKKKWIDKIRRGPNWHPTDNARVCALHFIDKRPSKDHPVPTLNLGYEIKKSNPSTKIAPKPPKPVPLSKYPPVISRQELARLRFDQDVSSMNCQVIGPHVYYRSGGITVMESPQHFFKPIQKKTDSSKVSDERPNGQMDIFHQNPNKDFVIVDVRTVAEHDYATKIDHDQPSTSVSGILKQEFQSPDFSHSTRSGQIDNSVIFPNTCIDQLSAWNPPPPLPIDYISAIKVETVEIESDQFQCSGAIKVETMETESDQMEYSGLQNFDSGYASATASAWIRAVKEEVTECESDHGSFDLAGNGIKIEQGEI